MCEERPTSRSMLADRRARCHGSRVAPIHFPELALSRGAARSASDGLHELARPGDTYWCVATWPAVTPDVMSDGCQRDAPEHAAPGQRVRGQVRVRVLHAPQAESVRIPCRGMRGMLGTP